MTTEDSGASSGSKGARTTLIGQWLKFAIQLVATVVLARVLSPAEFGLFSMIVAFSGLATLLGDFGLSSAAMQAKTLSNQQRSNLFWINTGIGLICACAVYFSAPLIAGFYSQEQLTSAIQMLAPIFIVQSAVSQLTANAARSLRFSLLAGVEVTGQFVGFMVALLLAVSGAGVLALVGQQITIAVWTLTVLAVAGRWLPLLPRAAQMRSLLQFGANSLLVQLLTYVTSNIDSVLLGRYWGAASLGLYDRAYQLFRMPVQQIATPLTRVVLPMLSRNQDDRTWVSGRLTEIQKLMAYSVAGVFIVLGANAASLIPILLGDDWESAAPILTILCIGGLFQAIGYVYYWAFLITNQTGVQLRVSVLTRSLMVSLIAAGTVLGPLGVATGVAVGLMANWLILSGRPMRSTGLDSRMLVRAVFRPIFVHLVANAPAMLLGSFLFGSIVAPLVLGLQIAVSIILYALLAITYKSFRNDLVSIKETLRKAL